MKHRNIRFVVACALAAGTSVQAQTVTTRASKINQSWVYGACGDSHSGNSEQIDNTLVNVDSESVPFHAMASGVCPGNQPYYSEIWAHAQHSFEFTGPLNNFSSLSARGLTYARCRASGLGVATIYTATPGNSVMVNFTITTPRNYHLSGFTNFNGNAGYVMLQTFDGFTWQFSPFYSLFLPGSKGFFNQSGVLGPGQYRIEGNANTNCAAPQDRASSFAYTLSFDDTRSVIQGYVDLQDISVDESGQQATIKVIQGSTVVDTQTVTLGNDGQYSITTYATGQVQLAASGAHWLTSKSALVTLTPSASTTFSPSLINGDCDGGNFINTDDYLILSGAFDTQSGDAGFVSAADLNLDDIVNTDDYLILSNNFDLVGD